MTREPRTKYHRPRRRGGAAGSLCGRRDAAASADLSISVGAAPSLIQPSDSLTYTLVIGNFGPTAASPVTLADVLPADVAYLTATLSEGGTCLYGSVVTCTLAGLSAGASVTATINVTAPGSSGFITNTATVVSAVPDLNPENNAATTITWVGPIFNVYLPLVTRDGPVSTQAQQRRYSERTAPSESYSSSGLRSV